MDFSIQTDHIVGGKTVFRNHNGKLVLFVDEAHIPVHAPLVNDPSQRVFGCAGSGALIAAPVGVVIGGIDIQTDKIQRLRNLCHIFLAGGIDTVSSYRFSCQNGVHPPAVAHEAIANLHTEPSCLFNLCRSFVLRNPSTSRKCNTNFYWLLCILPDGFDRRCMGEHTVPGQPGKCQVIMLEGGMGALHTSSG